MKIDDAISAIEREIKALEEVKRDDFQQGKLTAFKEMRYLFKEVKNG
jgi:hypothetical protein